MLNLPSTQAGQDNFAYSILCSSEWHSFISNIFKVGLRLSSIGSNMICNSPKPFVAKKWLSNLKKKVREVDKMDIKHFVEDRVFSKNYYLAKAGYLSWYHLKIRGKIPLLIYQMGKVASRSVQESLKAIQIDRPIIHLHYLSNEAIAIAENFYYDDIHSFNPHLKSNLPHDLFASYFVHNNIYENHRNNKKWKIITLVRDPVARNISGFFEAIFFRIPDIYKRSETISSSELLDAFLEAKEEHDIPLTWFDTELKPFFGIDVYASSFPQSQGYKIYTGEKADVLLLRVEDLSRIFSRAISEFLNVEGVTLASANTAKEKQYYNLYKMFLQNAVLPPFYLDKMYNSRFAQTFYTEEEIKKFVSRWRT